MSVKDYERDWDEEARVRGTSQDLIEYYTVEMTADDDGQPEIQAGIRFMRDASPHPKVTGAYLLEFRSKRIPGSNLFKVELEYSTDISQSVNPLGIPPVITGGFVARQVVRLVDAYGKVKCSTAGEFFEDCVVTVYDRVYKVVKNIPLQNPDYVDSYLNCVNSDAVTIKGKTWEPGTVLYVPGQIGKDDVGGPQQNVEFCESDFELHCRGDGWKTLIPNRGFFERVEIPLLSPLAGTVLLNPNASNANEAAVRGGQLPNDIVVGAVKGKRYVLRKILLGPAKEEPRFPVPLDKKGRVIPVPTLDNVVMLSFDDFTPKPFNGVLPLK